MASGATPRAFSFVMAARYSSQVAGGVVMPACWNRSLLYQKPIIPMSHGMPYWTPLYS